VLLNFLTRVQRGLLPSGIASCTFSVIFIIRIKDVHSIAFRGVDKVSKLFDNRIGSGRANYLGREVSDYPAKSMENRRTKNGPSFLFSTARP
jgi:hypothetical protein